MFGVNVVNNLTLCLNIDIIPWKRDSGFGISTNGNIWDIMT